MVPDDRTYDASTYGERIADVYDAWPTVPPDTDQAVDCLAALAGGGPILELGSGPGFLHEIVPTIRSEVFPLPDIDCVVDAQHLPFVDDSLQAVVMIDVLHHLRDVRRVFREMSRCVRRGGVVLMIEPWNTPWSRRIHRALRHEPFDPDAGWTHPHRGPLSGANGALPWIVFERDRSRFELEFPMWRIEDITLLMPLAYLVSGGLSMRSLAPGWAYTAVRRIEGRLPLERWAMFARIRLRKA